MKLFAFVKRKEGMSYDEFEAAMRQVLAIDW